MSRSEPSTSVQDSKGKLVGTIEVFDSVLSALFKAAERTDTLLGRPGTTIATLVEMLESRQVEALPAPGRALDDYIEAQVHGPVLLHEDVEAFAADPSFRPGYVGSQFRAIAEHYDIELRWHEGFELRAADVSADFRGPAKPGLAARIADEFGDRTGRLNAEIIGRAAQSVVTDPERWVDRGDIAETLQHIKQLWHVLVNFGSPAA